jgi:hypothetical protein
MNSIRTSWLPQAWRLAVLAGNALVLFGCDASVGDGAASRAVNVNMAARDQAQMIVDTADRQGVRRRPADDLVVDCPEICATADGPCTIPGPCCPGKVWAEDPPEPVEFPEAAKVLNADACAAVVEEELPVKSPIFYGRCDLPENTSPPEQCAVPYSGAAVCVRGVLGATYWTQSCQSNDDCPTGTACAFPSEDAEAAGIGVAFAVCEQTCSDAIPCLRCEMTCFDGLCRSW